MPSFLIILSREFMMKDYVRALSLILVLSLLLSFFGCEGGGEYTDEIIFTDDAPPSPQIGERAEGVFFALLEYYYKTTTVPNLPESTVSEIRKISHDLRLEVEKTPMSDMTYRAVLDLLESEGSGAIDELVARDRGEGDIDGVRSFYVELLSLLGANGFGSIAYDVSLYFLSYQYEKNMRNYEKYGYAYLLADAERLSGEHRILSENIGKESFGVFLSSSFALAEIFGSGGPAGADAFSDGELLLFIQNVDLSLSLDDESWELLLSRFSGLFADGISAEMLELMNDNGDISSVSAAMNDLLSLLSFVQGGLVSEDMLLVREGEIEALICRIFERFGDGQWQLFSDLTSVGLTTSDYERLLEKKYGSDYLDHAESVKPVSLDELRSLVGNEKFYESLKDYIGGISPAFSYGM